MRIHFDGDLINTDGGGSCSAKVLTHCSWKIRAASEAVANIIYWMYRQALGNFGGDYSIGFRYLRVLATNLKQMIREM